MLSFLIAISLSMDAFSLAIVYGMSKVKNELFLSLTIGVFHFFMPLLGEFLGDKILKFLPFNINLIAAILFIIIGFQMLLEVAKEEKVDSVEKLRDVFLFAFAVSFDSFVIGISLKYIIRNRMFSYLLFSITSFSLSFVGFKFGNIIGKKLGKISNILGSLIIISLGIVYLFK